MKVKHLYLSRKLMIITGLWTFEKNSLSWRQRCFYKFYSIFMQLFFTVFIICLLIGLNDLNNSNDIFEAVGIVLFALIIILKIFICQRKSVGNIFKHIADFDAESESLDEDFSKIYYSTAKYNVLYGCTLYFASIISVLSDIFCKFWIYKSEVAKVEMGLMNASDAAKPLPFFTWRPIDKDQHYYSAFIFDSVALFVASNYNTSAQVVYFSILTFIIAQLKMLQVKFRKFGSTVRTEEEIFDQLKELIREHQRAISFVKDLDDNMKYLLLLEFTINPLEITAYLYQIVHFKVDIMLIFRTSVFFVMLLQMFTLTWHANEIQFHSLEITKAIYSSKWYELSEKLKHRLMVVMLRAQKPLELNVGPFFTLTNATAVTSLKAAYSYLAFLNNAKK